MIALTKKEQDEKLKNKENEILELKKKIEDMSAEFAKMLKDTLEKMQERIRLAEWDNDNDPSMIKKIKEMNTLS
jgi:gas vesicle protein